ncbi:LON peptidase substrate-binding domain-containing protein [Belliella pelovolcani]|uniref:LON peptidase substrate-binding domain-containing protein n=1 Tax=Belliella pelovolcani TaxID=529505 RepID=UPI00391D3CAE
MMTETIPIFPLKLVAFPGEQLNLHIFEPRYRQLVTDIDQADGRFGISVYMDKLMPLGAEVKLKEISKVYDDGRMDIKTTVNRVYEMIRFENPFQDRLYAGGEVVLFENDFQVTKSAHAEFVFYLKEFFRLVDYQVEILIEAVNTFTFAHKIGLTLEQEYELLKHRRESDRTIFLINHLAKVIPVLREVEKAKEKIKMNGHFKNLDPLEF